MIAQAPAKRTEATTPEVTTTLAPKAHLILEHFRNGEKFKSEHLATLYEAKTQTTPRQVTIEITSARPTNHVAKITDRTAAANADALLAGLKVPALTLHGRSIGLVQAATGPAPLKSPTPKAGIPASFAELTAPALPKASAPFAGLALGIAAKALTEVLTESPQERKERQRRDQDEATKLRQAQGDLARTRAEIDTRLQSAKSSTKENLGAETAKIDSIAAGNSPEAFRSAIETARAIQSRVEAADQEKREPIATEREFAAIAIRPMATATQEPIATPPNTLIERYQELGAEGRFKSQILEALTIEAPTREARQTLEILGATPYGTAMITDVRNDLAELMAAPRAKEAQHAATETARPFESLIDDQLFKDLAFPGKLRRHAEAIGLAA